MTKEGRLYICKTHSHLPISEHTYVLIELSTLSIPAGLSFQNLEAQLSIIQDWNFFNKMSADGVNQTAVAEDSGNLNLALEDEKMYKLKLYRAALSNDWRKAGKIYKKTGMNYGAEITSRGETALHVAASAGHTEFVKKLVPHLTEDEIKIQMQTFLPGNGNTAFHCAAISGDVKIARAIAKDDSILLSELAMLQGETDDLPINFAASKGNKEMVRYLYVPTKHYLESPTQSAVQADSRKTFLLQLIRSEIYDVAFQMAQALLVQRIAPYHMEEDALVELARKPLRPHRSVGRFTSLFCRQMAFEKVVSNNAIELVELLWEEITSDDTRVSKLINGTSLGTNPILEAAKHGNLEFLSILIASYPDVLYTQNHKGYTIFRHAILNRHVHVFNLIHIGSVKIKAASFTDDDDSNMLHLAATLAPPILLNNIPGAALQLQRELLLFEEVKKVMDPREVNRKNNPSNEFWRMSRLLADISTCLGHGHAQDDNEPAYFQGLKDLIKQYHDAPYSEFSRFKNTKIERIRLLFEQMTKMMEQHGLNGGENTSRRTELSAKIMNLQLLMKEMKRIFEEYERNQTSKFTEFTPRDLFVKEHESLMEKGEKWMRDTANSCMIVTALITTIAFAAAITIPGGSGDDGYPHFLRENLFKAFTIADSISMISSTTSLLNFLSILTARYTIDDFRWSLPNKLVIGLSTLFISVVAMMVAFVLSIFIIFKNSPVWLAVVIAVVSSVPIILFIWQHSTLFLDVCEATYTSYSLFKSKKDPYLHIQEKKKRRKSGPFVRACRKVLVDVCHR